MYLKLKSFLKMELIFIFFDNKFEFSYIRIFSLKKRNEYENLK